MSEGLDTLPTNIQFSFILPTFNEAKSIESNLDRLFQYTNDHLNEVIVVDDGSTDGTVDRVVDYIYKNKKLNMRLLTAKKNEGKGAAIKRGMKYTSGRDVFLLDGGMEFASSDIQNFKHMMFWSGADMIVGSKRHLFSRVEYPWYRKALSRCYQWLTWLLFDFNVTDTQVGMKVMRRELVDAVMNDLDCNGYAFDVQLLALARKKGFKNIQEAPIVLTYAVAGGSVWKDIPRVFKMGFNLLIGTFKIWWKL